MCVGHKEAVPDIVKPASFKTQEFRRLVLENGIEFVLVSDAELDKAGAAIDVRCLMISLCCCILVTPCSVQADPSMPSLKPGTQVGCTLP